MCIQINSLISSAGQFFNNLIKNQIPTLVEKAIDCIKSFASELCNLCTCCFRAQVREDLTATEQKTEIVFEQTITNPGVEKAIATPVAHNPNADAPAATEAEPAAAPSPIPAAVPSPKADAPAAAKEAPAAPSPDAAATAAEKKELVVAKVLKQNNKISTHHRGLAVGLAPIGLTLKLPNVYQGLVAGVALLAMQRTFNAASKKTDNAASKRTETPTAWDIAKQSKARDLFTNPYNQSL